MWRRILRCFIAKHKIFDKEIVQKDSLTYTVASFHAYLLMKNSRFQRVHSNNWESSSGFQHILMNKFYLLPHCFYLHYSSLLASLFHETFIPCDRTASASLTSKHGVTHSWYSTNQIKSSQSLL